jgi:hypothetical protein
MNNQERFVKWKCPECGNYHKWVWDIYDIFGGEIAMTCDNPECGATSKMYMVVEKNGNATALVADNSQVEATEKVMNSQTEIDISRVLMDGDIVTIMGEKYKRVEEPKTPAEIAYKRVYGFYPETYEDSWSAFQDGYIASQKDYKVGEYQPTPQEPEELKTLYQFLGEYKYGVGEDFPNFDDDEFSILDWHQIFIDYLYECCDILDEDDKQITVKINQSQLGGLND